MDGYILSLWGYFHLFLFYWMSYQEFCQTPFQLWKQSNSLESQLVWSHYINAFPSIVLGLFLMQYSYNAILNSVCFYFILDFPQGMHKIFIWSFHQVLEPMLGLLFENYLLVFFLVLCLESFKQQWNERFQECFFVKAGGLVLLGGFGGCL